MLVFNAIKINFVPEEVKSLLASYNVLTGTESDYNSFDKCLEVISENQSIRNSLSTSLRSINFDYSDDSFDLEYDRFIKFINIRARSLNLDINLPISMETTPFEVPTSVFETPEALIRVNFTNGYKLSKLLRV
jgi:hypothetical protein